MYRKQSTSIYRRFSGVSIPRYTDIVLGEKKRPTRRCLGGWVVFGGVWMKGNKGSVHNRIKLHQTFNNRTLFPLNNEAF
jgi:hypothetical protein